MSQFTEIDNSEQENNLSDTSLSQEETKCDENGTSETVQTEEINDSGEFQNKEENVVQEDNSSEEYSSEMNTNATAIEQKKKTRLLFMNISWFVGILLVCGGLVFGLSLLLGNRQGQDQTSLVIEAIQEMLPEADEIHALAQPDTNVEFYVALKNGKAVFVVSLDEGDCEGITATMLTAFDQSGTIRALSLYHLTGGYNQVNEDFFFSSMEQLALTYKVTVTGAPNVAAMNAVLAACSNFSSEIKTARQMKYSFVAYHDVTTEVETTVPDTAPSTQGGDETGEKTDETTNNPSSIRISTDTSVPLAPRLIFPRYPRLIHDATTMFETLTVAPQTTVPVITEPVTIGPETTEPETIGAETTEPEIITLETTEPEIVSSEMQEPETLSQETYDETTEEYVTGETESEAIE